MDASERDKIGEMLSAYLDGELTGEQATEVEQLIADDAEARALLVELREAVDSVRQLPRAVAPSGILNEIQERVERQELLGPPDQPVTLSRHQRRPLRSILATAAALVITVGGGLWAISRLGEDLGQQHVATLRNHDELELQRQLKDFPQYVRERSSSPTASLGDTDVNAESIVAGRGGSDSSRDAAKTRSVGQPNGQANPAPEPAMSMPADKVRESKIADDYENKLALLKQSSDSTAPAPDVVGGIERTDLDEASRSTQSKPGADESRIQAGAEVRSLLNEGIDPNTATLEQKLANEMTVGELMDHRFANEPLRLDVQVASAEQTPIVADQIRSLIRLTDDARLGVAVRFDVRGETLEFRPGSTGDKSMVFDADTSLVVEGEPQHNFEPTARSETQYLARVDAETLTRILDETRKFDDGAIVGRRFAVGRMDAESDEDVQQLVAMTLGDDFAVRSAGALGGFAGGGPQKAGEPDDRKEAPTVDLAELLRGIGVGPPEVTEFGFRTDDAVESRKPAAIGTELQLADASDEMIEGGASGRKNQGVSPQSKAGPNAPSEEVGELQMASRRRSSRGLTSEEKAEADESEVAEPAVGEFESNVKPLEKGVEETDRLARQRGLKSKSSPTVPSSTRNSSPLYTIVIRLAPVAAPDASPVETASPPPTASPMPTVTPAPSAVEQKPLDSRPVQPNPTNANSARQAPIEMMEALPTASPEPAKNE